MSDVSAIAYLEAEIDGELRQFPLTADRIFRIGRSDKNNVVLNDDLASRSHAMLQRSDEGRFYLSDLGSSNGTFINGARVCAPTTLRNGDRIGIGNHEFCFRQSAEVEPPPTDQPDELQSTNILFAQSLITVLVADIRDFTGLARRVDSAKLSAVTRALFRDAGKMLQDRGAWAQKYIGDAVMAVWLHKKRTPELNELTSVFAALERLTEIAAGLQANFSLDTPVLIGAGVNTGWASVGNVGSIASSDYTALGDVVNKTFRLESATRLMPCDIALGQTTYDSLSSALHLSHIFQPHTVPLKGYEEPVTVYGLQSSSLPSLIEALHRSQPIS